MEPRRPAVEGTVDQVLVAFLELVRSEDPAGCDRGPEAGGVALEPVLHAVGQPLDLTLVPAAGDLIGLVGVHHLGEVGVRPERLGAGW